jgi:Ca2+/H+ antiporter, TMEM165/GDT1 family
MRIGGPAVYPPFVIGTMDAGQLGLVLAVTLAAAVEFVEAFTIVLAMGLTRDWRSTLAGTALALVVLAIVTVLAGYALVEWFPEALLQLVIGTLLLIFGLQWLRKAILRASGLKAMHDEEAIFSREAEAAREAGRDSVMGLDGFAFIVSFKGVFLEGLEVVFIVLTFGLSAGNIPLAIAGAAIAGAIVLVAGALLHRPLSRVPENTIKYGVGILLSTFGTFWAIEGLGVFTPSGESLEWPGGELALLVVLAAWIVVSRLLIATLRRGAAAPAPA